MNRKLLVFIVSIVIMLTGAIMANTMGFNKSIEYGEHTKILVYMNMESNIEDVKNLVSEVFGGRFEISYTDEFKDTISIKAQGISEEQIDNLKNKLQEKYQFEENTEYLVTLGNASIGTYELVKDYIKPVAISFLIVIAYFAFAYRKLGWINGFVIPALSIIIINALYVSFIAIFRIPLNEYIIPLGVLIYIMSLLGMTIYLNGKNKNKN